MKGRLFPICFIILGLLFALSVNCKNGNENRASTKIKKTQDKKKNDSIKDGNVKPAKTNKIETIKNGNGKLGGDKIIKLKSVRDLNFDLGDPSFTPSFFGGWGKWAKSKGAIKDYDIKKAKRKYLNKKITLVAALVKDGKHYLLYDNARDFVKEEPAPAGSYIFIKDNKAGVLSKIYKKYSKNKMFSAFVGGIRIRVIGYARHSTVSKHRPSKTNPKWAKGLTPWEKELAFFCISGNYIETLYAEKVGPFK